MFHKEKPDYHRCQYGFYTIDELVPEDHFLRQVESEVDFGSIYDLVEESYSPDQGRPKKGPKLGKPYYITDNKLDRDFQADKPMEKLVTDITYLYFGNCRLYLSSIMDLYNREIVAYTISDC